MGKGNLFYLKTPRPVIGWLFYVGLGILGQSLAQTHGSKIQNFSSENKASLLEIWNSRILENGGPHTWNIRNDARYVFQEWATILTTHQNSDLKIKRKIGRDLENYVVKGKMTSLAEIGTTLPLPWTEKADFDMAILGCISLIGLFEGDRVLMTDTTLVHLIKHVIGLWGQIPKYHFEVLGLKYEETENHFFMIESARFLTNQWIWNNTRNLKSVEQLKTELQIQGVELNNVKGELRNLILRQLQSILKKGLFEFNAQVYQRFTLHALNNLYSFSSDSMVRVGAGGVLDYLSTKFTFQSYESLRLPPFRRNAQKYKNGQPWISDAGCSFFAAQSGLFPGAGRPGLLHLWEASAIHSSVALFSILLKYRIPDVLLDYMQNKEKTYLAKMETRHEVLGLRESTPEIYLLSPQFMLTAGGRYKFYQGANFPITYSNYFTKEAPWVYDVIAQSSSVFLSPNVPLEQKEIPEFLKFKGLHWKGSNLAVYKNFVYGYSPARQYRSREWPQLIPSHWSVEEDRRFVKGAFEFRLLDCSSQGVYVILSRVKLPKTWWKHSYQKFIRGTVEVVDTSWVTDLATLETHKKQFPKNQYDKFQYPLWTGDVLQLNPRYNNKYSGIKWILNKEKRPPYHKEDFPLLEVIELKPPSLDSVKTVAFASGDGALWVKGSDGNSTLVVDFKSWWNPQRVLR